MEDNKSQELEGLILSWRQKIKEGCQERFNSIEPLSAWHEYDKEELEELRRICFVPLKEFDEHFNISSQRHGV